MQKFATALFFLAVAAISNGNLETGYYWREYTGKIPQDAIIGGKDINGDNVYIGQAFVVKEGGAGLIVVQIKPGVNYVYAELGGVNRVDNYVKILCGNQNFAWISSNATRLHVDLLNKNPVIGGHENGGTLNIGRIFYEGGTQIGKVDSYQIGNAIFYCVDRNNKQCHAQSYEVLEYINTQPL